MTAPATTALYEAVRHLDEYLAATADYEDYLAAAWAITGWSPAAGSSRAVVTVGDLRVLLAAVTK